MAVLQVGWWKSTGVSCRDGTSVTRVKYDDRYAGALSFTARYFARGSIHQTFRERLAEHTNVCSINVHGTFW